MVAGRWVSDRQISRKFGGEAALECLSEGGFGKGRECIVLTSGQFSAIDWLDAVLTYTGDAHAVIATWTAAAADLKRVKAWAGTCRLLSCRWIVDRSFPNRQPEICDVFREQFGDDTIRVFASHAKFMLIRNAEWSVVIQTSANLNHNARVENFSAADDPALFAAYAAMVEDVFKMQAPGKGFESDAGKRKPMEGMKAEAVAVRASRSVFKASAALPLK